MVDESLMLVSGLPSGLDGWLSSKTDNIGISSKLAEVSKSDGFPVVDSLSSPLVSRTFSPFLDISL